MMMSDFNEAQQAVIELLRVEIAMLQEHRDALLRFIDNKISPSDEVLITPRNVAAAFDSVIKAAGLSVPMKKAEGGYEYKRETPLPDVEWSGPEPDLSAPEETDDNRTASAADMVRPSCANCHYGNVRNVQAVKGYPRYVAEVVDCMLEREVIEKRPHELCRHWQTPFLVDPLERPCQFCF